MTARELDLQPLPSGQPRQLSPQRPASMAQAWGLLLSGFISQLGDGLAAIAAALLVSARTDSAGLTALTLAAAYLPGLFGGLGLTGLADRFPRRGLCVAIDVLRVPMVLVLCIPGIPVAVILVGIAMIELVGQPFSAARAALLPQVLPPQRLGGFVGLDRGAAQLTQFFGVVIGAAAVAVMGAREALVLDAASFAVSALVIVILVRAHPRPVTLAPVSLFGGAAEGWRAIRQIPLAYRAVLCTWIVVAVAFVAEGLAVPLSRGFAGSSAESSVTTGSVLWLLGSYFGVGAVLSLFVGRLPETWQDHLLMPLAVLSLLPGLVFFADVSRAVAVAAFAVGGLALCVSTMGRIAFSRVVPDEVFGRAIGVAAGIVLAVQGVALLVAAGLAEVMEPRLVIADSAALGVLLLLLVIRRTRVT
jgi:hypothetical protein